MLMSGVTTLAARDRSGVNLLLRLSSLSQAAGTGLMLFMGGGVVRLIDKLYACFALAFVI